VRQRFDHVAGKPEEGKETGLPLLPESFGFTGKERQSMEHVQDLSLRATTDANAKTNAKTDPETDAKTDPKTDAKTATNTIPRARRQRARTRPAQHLAS